MRRLRILALAAALAAANCSAGRAARAAATFARKHGGGTSPVRARVRARFCRPQRTGRRGRLARHRKRLAHATAGCRPGNARRLAPGIRAHPPRADVRGREGYSRDLRTPPQLPTIPARTGRLLWHPRPEPEDVQAMPKVLPEAFASVLPRMQPMMAETQDSFPQAPARARPAQLTAKPSRQPRRALR